MKNIIIAVLVIVVLGVSGYFVFRGSSSVVDNPDNDNMMSDDTTKKDDNMDDGSNMMKEDKTQSVIGKSVNGKDIIAYHFGDGEKEVMFVGGIHGGYSWNTTLVGYEAIDFLKQNPSAIPEGVKVTVIPVLNPDGLLKVVATSTAKFSAGDVVSVIAKQTEGRFNANNVDLNRNFDCDWQANAKWQDTPVSGGKSAFSEPESLAMKNYIESRKPKAVVVWYSAAGGVFSSSCHNGVLPETNKLTQAFAKASGYKAYEGFDFYVTTGDMVNWLAKNNVPAISVLLTNHSDTEWAKNKAGIEAVLNYYKK